MTYEELAAQHAVRLCVGCTVGVDHQVGAHATGMIHWRQRRVTRPGLRRFLKLVASSMYGLEYFNEPEKTYLAATTADDLARAMHIRFPRRYAALDRAKVREALPGARLNKETRKMITRWARA